MTDSVIRIEDLHKSYETSAGLFPALKDVSLGITDNSNTEIVAGELKAGDQLVVGDAQAADKSKSSSSSGSRPPMRMF